MDDEVKSVLKEKGQELKGVLMALGRKDLWEAYESAKGKVVAIGAILPKEGQAFHRDQRQADACIHPELRTLEAALKNQLAEAEAAIDNLIKD